MINRDGLHVSVSQVKTYLRCPRQYELKYLRGEAPAFVPEPLALGSAVHAGLAAFYLGVQEQKQHPPLEEVLTAFRDTWSRFVDGGLPIVGGDGDGVQKGVNMLAAFYRVAAAAPLPDVHAVEMPFAVELHDPATGEIVEERLVGAFDLVILEGNKRIVVEHKTAARKWSEDQLRFDQQPTVYQMVARQLGFGNVALRLQVLTKTKIPAVCVDDVDRTFEDEAEATATILGVLRAVDAGIFYPVRGAQCRSCPYAGPCTRVL